MTTKNLLRQAIALAVAVFLTSGGVAAQEWQALHFPDGSDITGASFIHPDTGFVVTNHGYIGSTVDGGLTWHLTPVTSGAALEDVSFLNRNLGYVCGRSGSLYRTVDGGRSWDDLSLADTVPWLYDVEMLDSTDIIVAGATRAKTNPYEGLLLRSEDAGNSFDTLPIVGVGYKEFFYRQGKPLYLLTTGGLSRSDDLGKDWDTRLTIDGKPGRALAFAGRTGLIAGPRGMLAFSSDSGQTWRSNDRAENQIYIAAELIDENVGYIGGWPETIIKTTDAGRSWTEESFEPSFNVLDFCRIGDRLYAVGSGGGIAYKIVK